MRRHRVITTAAFLALAVPTTAQASSLLSGYGGPGQGNQAILGATVIGGPAGGGSSGSSRGSSASSGGGLALSSTPGSTPSTRTKAKSHAKAHTRAGASEQQAHASAGAPNAYRASSTLYTTETAAVSTPTLGISSADLVYILLAFAALAVTAVITSRLVRRSD